MKTALITGAYGAIGREIAFGLVKDNYRTLLVGRNEIKLNKLRTELQSNNEDAECKTYVIDLSSKTDIIKLTDSIDEKIDEKSVQSHYFIKFTNGKTINDNIKKLSTITYDINNTVGPRSISKQELIKEFNPLLES